MYWAEPPSFLTATAQEADPVRRSMAILKWFVVTRNGERKGIGKKPLNPFLGEQFLGSFDEADAGHTSVIAECVSHHPPISAFQIENEEHGIRLQGYSRTKMNFSTSLCIEHVGHAMLHLSKYAEHYLVVQPRIYLSGILPPWREELGGKSYIIGSNDIVIELEFSTRSWFGSGSNHAFTARAYRHSAASTAPPIYTAKGTWKPENYTVRDGTTGAVLETVKLQQDSVKTATIHVKPLAEQGPLESRRAWSAVAEAINKGDFAKATVEKSKIEETQRAARRAELADREVWKTHYFGPGDSNEAATLLAKVDGKLRENETKGVWRWKA